MLSKYEKDKLLDIARKVRRWVLISTTKAGSGHPGGSLSCVDILTVLYFRHLRCDPKNPQWEDRDRFVLSKGHAAPTLYAILALKGFFDEKELYTLRKLGSRLQGHPDMKLPGIEISTGSLGQGFSASIGMALAGKMDKKDYLVYVLLGDGELDEGIVWEAFMSANHYKLNNLKIIIDRNRFQIDGRTEDIMSLESLEKKLVAFGFKVFTIDGHNLDEIDEAFIKAKEINLPSVIIANTIKGKGISFLENNNAYHGKALSEEELERALKELGG
jgi:transketolase